MAQLSGDSTSRLPGHSQSSEIFDLAQELTAGRKVIVASNRGPLSFTMEHAGIGENPGQLNARQESNRTVEIFSTLADFPVTWISASANAADRAAMESLAGENGIHSEVLPVGWSVRFVSTARRVPHRFYNVICNPLLWFLLHRSWSPTFTPAMGPHEHDAWDRGYVTVNRMFADEIAHAARISESPPTDQTNPGRPIALVVRDYQLMLVAGMVRKDHPKAIIHQSFETPWPWPSDLEILPEEWRTSIFDSLLSADVVAFPTARDIRAFVSGLGEYVDNAVISADGRQIAHMGRIVRLVISGPTVRTEQILRVREFSSTQRLIAELGSGGDPHVFVTVDRAEPNKNIIRSIEAFDELLKQNADLAGHARFLLVLTPGPSHISGYRRLSDEIERAARRVNDRISGDSPVRVFLENNFYRTVAALAVYDTLVSVPVVDGLGRSAMDGPVINSVSGNLILSDTNPAAELFGDSVFLVAFADTVAIRDAMAAAIAQTDADRRRSAGELKAIVDALKIENAAQQLLGEMLAIDSSTGVS
ncbi:MAG: trehalose-6-phosphate synthase [Chloroflexi bacterium]|nr:trehalose-6-phosphate synthase [Chloroflexota bacterium]